MTVESLLREGIAALKVGHRAKARNLLMQAIEQDEHNETAWLWLSGAVDTDEARAICLRNVLVINPGNEVAQRGLASLAAKGDMQPTTRAEYAPASREQPAQRLSDVAWRREQAPPLDEAPPPEAAPPPEEAPPLEEAGFEAEERKARRKAIIVGILLLPVTLVVLWLAIGFFLPSLAEDINARLGIPFLDISAETRLGDQDYVSYSAEEQRSETVRGIPFEVAAGEVVEVTYEVSVEEGQLNIYVEKDNWLSLDDTAWRTTVRANQKQERTVEVTIPQTDHYTVKVNVWGFRGEVKVWWKVKR